MDAMTPAAAESFRWNIVTKEVHGHPQLRQRLRRAIARLERHLQTFPPDTVHLQIRLDGEAQPNRITAALTLRLPSNILHAEKAHADAARAVEEAVSVLVRQLEALKERLRREPAWKRKARRERVAFAAEPLPAGAGPETAGEVARSLFEMHRAGLARYARRLLGRAAPSLPAERVEAEVASLVGEAADKLPALMADKPARMSERAWHYRLVREALQARLRRIGAAPAAPSAPPASPAEADQARQALVAALDQALAGLSAAEREIFDLHFHEGFAPEEVAMVVGKPPAEVRRTIGMLAERLRDALRHEEATAAAAAGTGA
ncbi:HPF/RaiA family ribosome-associated protein [Caldovatus aquaticus]|uniref:HPF/RaiA family ribosome-associated protein n=1 Tax=Caldovatus aquaticus TaxID=2865671 RepID=A0ABS7F2T0_9PROT|nr:HPF/RaiA family ribosome-associated protein [Caldovatus aquaticus]MBW8269623.1 HPF/RaiA family ribosome-associated protein [Caldovatus aquaticus]